MMGRHSSISFMKIRYEILEAHHVNTQSGGWIGVANFIGAQRGCERAWKSPFLFANIILHSQFLKYLIAINRAHVNLTIYQAGLYR
jgi:hypothetical protein